MNSLLAKKFPEHSDKLNGKWIWEVGGDEEGANDLLKGRGGVFFCRFCEWHTEMPNAHFGCCPLMKLKFNIETNKWGEEISRELNLNYKEGKNYRFKNPKGLEKWGDYYLKGDI